MKYKIILIVVCLVLLIGLTGYIIWNNNAFSIIYFDVNPSVELKIDKNEIVKDIIAKNEDGNKIISDDLVGRDINDVINSLFINMIDNGFIDGDNVFILLYSVGQVDNQKIKGIIDNSLDKKNIYGNVIIIDNVTKEDEELANKYSISPSKAAYLNSVIKNNDIEIENLVYKSINEVKETKENGRYCDKDYVLDGSKCLKEISRTKADNGEICPYGYSELDGKCYEETRGVDSGRVKCMDGFELIDNKCVNEITYDAHGKCDVGEFVNSDYCVEKKYIADAYEFCRDPGRTLYEHKCLATKPSINGGCLNGDKYLNGKCVNTKNDYYAAEWKCPNGQIKSNHDGSLVDNDTKCYEETKTKVSYYYCDDNDTLVDKKCQRTTIESPLIEFICPEGYTMTNNDRCINMNKSIDKTIGPVCDEKENIRIKGDMCITYEIVEAKQS